MMGWGNQGYGMGGFGGIMMIVFWGLIIFCVVMGIKYFTAGHGGRSSGSPERDPLQILRERYAKGEIDTEEYEERRKVLQKEILSGPGE